MPHTDTDFYSYVAKEDERAAQRLDSYLSSLLQQRASLAALKRGFGGQQDLTSSEQDIEAAGALHLSASCKRLITAFKEKLSPGRPQVLLPSDLTARLARNIVRMVEGEERGIRGCAIIVTLMDGRQKVTLGKIVCDPTCTTTTTLHLRLHRADGPDGSICNDRSNSTDERCSDSNSDRSKNSSIIYISPGYTLEKRHKPKTKKRRSESTSSDSSSSLPLPGGTLTKNKGSRCNMGSMSYDDYY